LDPLRKLLDNLDDERLEALRLSRLPEVLEGADPDVLKVATDLVATLLDRAGSVGASTLRTVFDSLAGVVEAVTSGRVESRVLEILEGLTAGRVSFSELVEFVDKLERAGVDPDALLEALEKARVLRLDPFDVTGSGEPPSF